MVYDIEKMDYNYMRYIEIRVSKNPILITLKKKRFLSGSTKHRTTYEKHEK